MISFSWPNMIGNVSANLVEDKKATESNLKLLLLSDKNSLLGDPYFGTNLKKIIFNQNNQVIKDLIIDDIYTAILTFMPQLLVHRKDITVVNKNATVYINIKATNLLDYTTNLYNIGLTSSEEK